AVRTVAYLSGNERGRLRRVRHQRPVAWGTAFGGAQHPVVADRRDCAVADQQRVFVDLSHVIEPGMTTYKGLPGPVIADYWTRDMSASFYEDGANFHIDRIDMVANTGTYLDAPFHRYAEGADMAGLDLTMVAGLDGLVVRVPHRERLAIEGRDFAG